MNPEFTLKISESAKDLEWYKSIINNAVPYDTTAIADYDRMRMAYALLNNDLTLIKDKLDQFYKPLGSGLDFLGQIDEVVIPYNKLYSKFMYHIGQMLKYGDDMQVVINSDTGFAEKAAELAALYEASIEEYAQLQHELADMENAGASSNETDEYYNNMRTYPEPEEIDPKQYVSNLERFYSKVVSYFKYKHNVRKLKAMSFRHALASDRPLVGIFNNNGIPYPEVINPLHFGFHKSPDEDRIEKGDYWWYKVAITPTQAYDELKDKLSDEELRWIESYTGDSRMRTNRRWDIASGAEADRNYSNYEMFRQEQTYSDKHVGQGMASGSTRRFNSSRLIWKTYFEFKAFKEVGMLKYQDEDNKTVYEFVDSSYPVPKDYTKVKITNIYQQEVYVKQWIDAFGNPVQLETLWMPRRYQVKRYGADRFIDYMEVPNQPTYSDPFDFELSVKGRVLSGLNAEPVSIVERGIPGFLQIVWIKNLQNKELSKYEGFIKAIDTSQIPDYLTKDETGQPLFDGADKLTVWRYYRRKLGDSYFDSSQDSNGLPNFQKTSPVSVEASGAIAEIVNLQNLVELADREMGLQMLVPPQAEGVFQTYSNATDNQQALQQGFIMAEEIYAEHNDVWRSAINEYLHQFRNYYKRFFEDNPDVKETFLQYITPDGSKETLRVTPDYLSHEDMGIFIQGNNYGNDYRNFMVSRLQDFAQNRGEGMTMISELVKAVAMKEDPETIHKMIVTADKKQQQRIQEAEKARQEAQIKMLQEQNAMQDKQNAQRLAEIDLQNKGRVDLEIAKASLSNDKDGIPTDVEVAERGRKLAQKDRELTIKEIQANK